MKIALLNPFSLGFAIKVTRIGRYLSHMGHDVYLILPKQDPKHGIGSERPLESDKFHIIHPFQFRSNIFEVTYLPYILSAVRQLRRIRPDVACSYHMTPLTVLPPILANHNRIIFSTDDYDSEVMKGNHPHYRVRITQWIERDLSKKCEFLILASKELKKLYLSFGVHPSKIRLIPNGVDISMFTPNIDGGHIRQSLGIDENTQLVTYIGNIDKSDHVRILLKVVPYALRLREDIVFMIVGRVTDEFRREIDTKITPSDRIRIVFTGIVPYRSVPDHIAASDVMLATFTDTPYSRCGSHFKIFEYMAMGKPIVATKVGDSERYLDRGKAGILVEPWDFQGVVNAINTLLEDRELATKLGRAAMQRVIMKYTWERVAEEYEKVLKEALA